MIWRFPSCCLLAVLMVSAACRQDPTGTSGPIAEPYIPDSNSVGFDIESVQGSGSSQQWLVTYNSQGKTAKFRIELGQPKASKAKDTLDFDIESGEGKFIAEPGSDANVLLADLKKALEAKTLPTHVKRVDTLPFTYVSFGKNQSQAPGGGFNAKPPGHWTPMKIFIGEGEEEGEVFVNLNPATKRGQFSIKDPDYGDIVLAQLARVL
jgi:hypothetical protein